MRLRITGGALTLCAMMTLTACDRPPSDQGLPEWTATDHDRNEEQQRAASGQQMPSSAAQAVQAGRRDGGGPDPLATLVDATWRTQCAICHGITGRGDGPNGPMVRAANFADPDFQKSRTDEELTASILNGKGRMPKFDLPPQVAAALVKRVRIFGAMPR